MSPAARRWIFVGIAVAVVVVVVVAALVVVPAVRERQERSRAANDLRNLLDFAVSSSAEKGWPRDGGRAIAGELAADVGAPDLSRYAFRRNDEAAHRLGDDSAGQPEVLIADLGFADGVLLGRTDRSVVWRSKAELGFAPDEGIVVGESSKSPVLRALRR